MSMTAESPHRTNRQFLHCRPADGDRLVRLENIVECIPMVELDEQHRPDNPHYRGLLHFRGRVLPVVDLADDSSQALQPTWLLLVLCTEDRELALVTRQVFQIASYPSDRCKRVDIGSGDTLTVVSSDSRMLRVIEPESLLVD